MATTTDESSLPQRVKRFYERRSVEGEAAMPELKELYSDDIHFINPVVDEVGLAAFEVQWQKALKSYKIFQFENVVVVGTEEVFTLTYDMNVKFSFGPIFKSSMATDCHGKDGKVYLCLGGERHDPVTLASAWIPLIEFLVTGTDELVASALTLPILAPIFRRLAKFVPAHIGSILGVFVSAGKNGAPVTQYSQDRSFLGLPMDNQMDDLLMPTWFTELWIPFTPGDGKVTAVVGALRKAVSHGLQNA